MAEDTRDKKLVGDPTGQIAFRPIRSATGALVPVSFGSLVWRYQNTLGLSIVVKASFSLDSDPMRPRNPEPVHPRDIAWEGGAAMLAPCDLVPRRPQVDITLAGKAHAPSGREEQPVNVRLAVMQQGLVVIDRSQDLANGATSPFAAFSALHESRRSLLGATPQRGEHGVLEIPGNLPWRYYQAAPSEQCVDALRGDALFVIEGMSPRHSTIRAALPDVWAVGSIFGLDDNAPQHGNALTLQADTVALDAERSICSVVWRAELGLPSVDALSRLTVAAGVAIRDQPVSAPTTLVDSAAPGRAGASAKRAKRKPLPPRKRKPPQKAAVEEVELDVEPDTDIVDAASLDEPLPFAAAVPGKVPDAIVRVMELLPSPAQGATLAASGKSGDAAPLPFGALVDGAAGKTQRASDKPHRSGGGIAAWAAAVAKPEPQAATDVQPESHTDPPAGAQPESPPQPSGGRGVTEKTVRQPASERNPAADNQRPGGATLPFKASEGGAAMPSAARWAALVAAADAGATVVTKGAADTQDALPFAAGQKQAKQDEARAQREAEDAKVKAEVARRKAEDKAAREEADKANAEKRQRDEEAAASRAAEEKRRFEEGQRLLREKEAKRKAEEQSKKLDEAKELSNDLYGSFED